MLSALTQNATVDPRVPSQNAITIEENVNAKREHLLPNSSSLHIVPSLSAQGFALRKHRHAPALVMDGVIMAQAPACASQATQEIIVHFIFVFRTVLTAVQPTKLQSRV